MTQGLFDRDVESHQSTIFSTSTKAVSFVRWWTNNSRRKPIDVTQSSRPTVPHIRRRHVGENNGIQADRKYTRCMELVLLSTTTSEVIHCATRNITLNAAVLCVIYFANRLWRRAGEVAVASVQEGCFSKGYAVVVTMTFHTEGIRRLSIYDRRNLTTWLINSPQGSLKWRNKTHFGIPLIFREPLTGHRSAIKRLIVSKAPQGMREVKPTSSYWWRGLSRHLMCLGVYDSFNH